MQLGFVIDHSRCIGCHACTVACKAENDVPLGNFRTWVKYTESGAFPDVRRSFAVLRCNQCTDAPCVTICPVSALEKRPDGIVDVDPAACIGCKACLQGCPYDALYLNEGSGTAEKCHFCAHRVESGLAPACAVVCPTEAIIPGDFHDPESVVSRMARDNELVARKPEAGTGPNVLYLDAAPAGIDPLRTAADGGYLWSGRLPGVDVDSEEFLATQQAAEDRARTTYDVDRLPAWGWKVSAYLFTKSLAAGFAFALALTASPLSPAARARPGLELALTCGALFFLLLTTVLLVIDLKRPERFLYIVLRPNWSSWLARGTIVLVAYGGFLGHRLAFSALGIGLPRLVDVVLMAVGLVLAALTAAYTAWLFGQAKGRVLWMRRGLWAHLIVQAAVAGFAAPLIVAPLVAESPVILGAFRLALPAALAMHLVFTLMESKLSPPRREEEYRRASSLITHGPFASRHFAVGIAAGIAAPAVLLLMASPWLWALAGALALVGLWVEEDTLVRAGQALPIS